MEKAGLAHLPDLPCTRGDLPCPSGPSEALVLMVLGSPGCPTDVSQLAMGDPLQLVSLFQGNSKEKNGRFRGPQFVSTDDSYITYTFRMGPQFGIAFSWCVCNYNNHSV